MYSATRVLATMALVAMAFAGPAQSRPPQTTHDPGAVILSPTGSRVSLDRRVPGALRSAAAAPDTTVLGAWSFDNGGCDTEGWTSVDNTAQTGTWFHVDDFAGLGGGDFGRLNPLEGNQSLWCGARPTGSEPLCSYASLPGYGNSWTQFFQTSECIVVNGDAIVDFYLAWDVEESYDYATLEVVECGAMYEWQYDVLAGGSGNWDGVGNGFFSVIIDDAQYSDSLRVRFRFQSDPYWSDETGEINTDGAVILDSLTVSDGNGVLLATETFEGESVGATTTLSGSWTAVPEQGFGDFAGLFPGTGVLQEDPCASNLTCLWGFFAGSTENYGCGGYPLQAAVPDENTRSQYIDNEIRSPWIALNGAGATYELAFDVYRDLPIEAYVFYGARVRFTSGGCPTAWQEIGASPFYFGDQKDWFRFVKEFSTLVPPGVTSMQVAIGAADLCRPLNGCFFYSCHSHAPLIDNVQVRRIDSNGPRWAVRDIDLFQDNFASDGTLTGTVRADAAIDIVSQASNTIRPGDSVAVHVGNPEGGLAIDSHTGNGAAAYTYVNVHPPGQPGKGGAALSSDPLRWPVVDSLVYGGDKWYCLRMDSAFGGSPQDTAFCIDLNDNLFTPGDTIFYVFSAIADPGAEITYYSRFTGTTDDAMQAFSNPMEFTCLPTQGYGLNTLYVDACDGTGVQPYFEAAFDYFGIHVDRYDVLSPTSNESNTPAGRVVDVAAQLSSVYDRIIWSNGDLGTNIPGGGVYFKVDDAAMLTEFLDLIKYDGGIYLTGDNLAEEWGNASSSLTLRSTYIDHSLVNGDHVDAGYPVSPTVIGTPGGIFYHGSISDQWTAYGGCPSINDFDVLTAQGAAVTMATYDGGGGGAVIAQETQNQLGGYPRVVLSGFSFHETQNVTTGGTPDVPAALFYDIYTYLYPVYIVDAGDPPALRNALTQNVPNPFNPTTAIEFTVKERAPVTLRIYNVRGQLVKTLVDDTRAPGITHRIQWDGRNDAGQRVASGVYFYRLVTKGFVKTRKMVLLK